MGIFSAIMDKLRHRGEANASQAQRPGATQSPTPSSQSAQKSAAPPAGTSAATASAGASPSAAAQGATQPALQNVDVDAVLSRMAAQKGGGGNYLQSIVDLLKLLDLDSSLTARKELAQELNVHAGEHGSAEQNIALHKAVMRKLAEHGGKVPESLRS